MQLAVLEIPAEPEYVSVARLVVSTVAGDRYDLSDDQLDSLKLAVSEACVLAIQGGDSANPGAVSVRCEGEDDRVSVSVSCGGDWSAVDKQSGEGFESQFGVPMIRSLVDEIEIDSNSTHGSMKMTVLGSLAEDL